MEAIKPQSIVTNEDCMIGMARYPDKYFDLAIVDPPYGIGEDGLKNHSRNQLTSAKKYTPKEWDKHPITHKYFEELFRISKNQIVFGANHFISRLYIAAPMMKDIDSPCWIVWDKDNTGDFADCELAWTSFNTAVRKFKFRWNGMLQQDMKNKEERIHPTQKPIKLYRWLLHNYANIADKILDTHLGSGSSRIAAYDMGFDFTGFELDKDYFDAQEKRFANHIKQLTMFPH